MSGHTRLPVPRGSKQVRRGAGGLLLALVLAACDVTPDEPPCLFFCPSPPPSPVVRSQVVGTYDATRFDLDDQDLLPSGAEIMLTLRADSVTEGRLFVPRGGDEGEDLDADLAGRWTFAASDGVNGVRLEHEADTFLRDIFLQPARDGETIVLSGSRGGDGSPYLYVELRHR